MKLKFYQETTDWGQYRTPNHIYLLSENKDKAYGYIRRGTESAEVFKTPYRFDTRGRKFKLVPELEDIDMSNPEVSDRWEVVGSQGDVYVVERIEGVLQCSCSGFKFRGSCKHVKDIGEKNGS
jgi:hypothetical protein